MEACVTRYSLLVIRNGSAALNDIKKCNATILTVRSMIKHNENFEYYLKREFENNFPYRRLRLGFKPVNSANIMKEILD